jgi:glucose/arabinose dehydrogenase
MCFKLYYLKAYSLRLLFYTPNFTAMTTKFSLYSIYRTLLMLCFVVAFKTAATAQPILSLTPVIASLNSPIQFVNAGDGSNRVFIVEKGGTVKVYDAAFNFLDSFVTVSNISSDGERGLLSMAFHPNYATNGFFYVYYTNAAGNLEIARYHVSSNPNRADDASRQTVITIPHPTNANHNGGELHFGPDGFLYLSTGDGGGAGDLPNNAQNTGVLLGKMLRLNMNTSATAPFYTIPAGNPYSNEIFALGLRNPFRWSFDRLTNDMWIGDVGQGSWEEIDYRPADSTNGVNYGWRCYEGDSPYNTAGCSGMSNYVFPVYVYPNPSPAAVTGGIVYRGTASPAIYGYYIAADFYSGEFFMINPGSGGVWTTNVQVLTPTGIADFGEAENGEAYVVSLTSNTVYRLMAVEGAPVPVTLVSFSGSVVNKQVQLQWKTSLEQNLKLFDVEYSVDGSVFAYAGTIQAKNAPTGAEYSFTHATNSTGNVFYRLKMKDDNGKFSYSGTIRVDLTGKDALLVSPSVITDGIIRINLVNEAVYSSVEVVNSAGAILIKRDIEGQTGRVSIPSSELTPGIYIVRFINKRSEAVMQKIVIQ